MNQHPSIERKWTIPVALLALVLALLSPPTGLVPEARGQQSGETNPAQAAGRLPQDSLAADTLANEVLSSTDSTIPAPADTSLTGSVPRYSPDSLAVPDQPDSSVVDSAASQRADSLQQAHQDSIAALRAQLEALREAVLRDTMAPPPASPTALTLDRRDWSWHPYRGSGEAVSVAPGIWGRNFDLFGQPYYGIVPGGSGRDLMVLYRDRPWNDPATDAANLSAFAVEEINRQQHEEAWGGSGPMASGRVSQLEVPYYYPVEPATRVVYRQGFYGLGHADWRIAQQITEQFQYHFGVNIGEYTGRIPNSVANTSLIRLGAGRRILGLGHLQLAWMQSRIDTERPLESGLAGLHRNDLDLLLSGGDPDERYRELALWYTRNQRGFGLGGDNDGSRLGARGLLADNWLAGHRLLLRGDVEYVAARFFKRPRTWDPHGRRLVIGATASDLYEWKMLSLRSSLRTEYGSMWGEPDSTGGMDALRLGGSASARFGDSTGASLLAQIESGWRWPSLDEAYGSWSVARPDRWMDLPVIPDYYGQQQAVYYEGRDGLEPVDVRYAGLGAELRRRSPERIRVMAGVRSWNKLIDPLEIDSVTFTRSQGRSLTALEATAWGNWRLLGPLYAAAAWTFSSAVEEGDPIPPFWGWSSLRFDRSFYDGQLDLRVALTGNYYGPYEASGWDMPARWLLDGLVRAKIYNFEAYFGVQNILNGVYHFVPGYRIEHRSEIWGVRWLMWG